MIQEEEFWVFGYGSLMWRPDFPYIRSEAARLSGYLRSFCIYSHYYRGTPKKPGLVLGLDPVASAQCEGVAFLIDPADKEAVISYLTERELCGYAYQAKTLPICLRESQTQVNGYCFVADPDHALYAGELDIEKAAEIIMEASGEAGLNRDYLINSVRELEQHGYADASLHGLLKRVEYLTGMIEAGGGI